MKIARTLGCLMLVYTLSGCALGLFDEDGRDIDGLPTQGVGPYGKPDIDFDTPADEPYVLTDRQASLWNPSALLRADGGFRIWYGREDVNAPAGESDIWMFGLADILELPDEVEQPVLSPGEAWEQGRVASPSVLDRGDGRLVMFYEGGIANPGIGRADSTDGGITWQKHPQNPIVENAVGPGVAELEGEWFMFYTIPGRSGIFLADSTDGETWTARDAAVIQPRTQLRLAFDNHAVSAPFPVVERTPAGQRHFGLFFNGENVDGDVSIGYAGSFDGEVWHSFSVEEPIVDGSAPPEFGPTVVRTPARAIMFFSEARQGRQRITVATHP